MLSLVNHSPVSQPPIEPEADWPVLLSLGQTAAGLTAGKALVCRGLARRYSSRHPLPLISFRLLVSPPVLRSACRLNTWPSDRRSAGPQVSGRYGRVTRTQGAKCLRCLVIAVVETLG